MPVALTLCSDAQIDHRLLVCSIPGHMGPAILPASLQSEIAGSAARLSFFLKTEHLGKLVGSVYHG